MTGKNVAISLITCALLAGCATRPDPCPDAPKVLIDDQLICGYNRQPQGK